MDSNVIELVKDILVHAANYQYLQSKVKYDKLQVILKNCLSSDGDSLSEATRAFVDQYKDEFQQIVTRAAETELALSSISLEAHEFEWMFASEYLGVCTHYSVQSNGLIAVHLHGNVDNLPFFEQLAVINEIDLFTQWVPFCSSAEVLKRIGKAELLAHFSLSFPMISRDASLRAYGVDCLKECDSIVLLGGSIPTPDIGTMEGNYHLKYSSIEIDNIDADESTGDIRIENITEDINIPWENPKNASSNSVFNYLSSIGSHNHMDIKYFRAVFTVESSRAAKGTIVYTVDPRANIPQFMLTFAFKNLAGIMLYLLQSQAEKVENDPNCTHSQRMRENKAFYVDWLLPKFRDFCSFKNWPQPNIASLGAFGMPP